MEIGFSWNECLIAMNQYNKTSVSVSHSVAIVSLARNSTKVIVNTGTTVSVYVHDFTAEKFIPSVNCWMNIGMNIGELMKTNVYVHNYGFLTT